MDKISLVHFNQYVSYTPSLALILLAVKGPLGINSVCILESKKLDWLSLSCAQARPIKLFGWKFTLPVDAQDSSYNWSFARLMQTLIVYVAENTTRCIFSTDTHLPMGIVGCYLIWIYLYKTDNMEDITVILQEEIQNVFLSHNGKQTWSQGTFH